LKEPRRKLKGFWRGLARRLGVPSLAFLVLLFGVRLAMPYAVRDFVNDRLNQLKGFRGQVGKIRINLYRGAYTVINLRILKTGGRVPVPFVTVPVMDLSVEWSELLRGSLVGRITMDRPEVNFVSGPTEGQQQAGFHEDWEQTLKSISPFTINRFQINGGSIRFLNPYRQPPVNIYITNLFATATNLTNVRGRGGPLPAGLVARGKTIGGGELHLELHMNPLASTPTFKLLASVTNLDLTALNNFLRAYAAFDVARGKFSLLADVAAANGRYQGYAKPFFLDLQVFDLQKEARKKNPLQIVWEAIVGAITEIFRNQPQNQLATVIPISGSFQKGARVDLWTTIGGILQNAFVQALSPKFIRPVPLPAGNQSRARAP
jgi:hypothetical protein